MIAAAALMENEENKNSRLGIKAALLCALSEQLSISGADGGTCSAVRGRERLSPRSPSLAHKGAHYRVTMMV